jgi:Ca-activated chloride channel family protein
MRRTVPLFLVVLLLSGLPAVVPAQQAPTFRSSTQTVAVYATVLDRDGRLVPDLEQQHFQVLDNGVPQPITIFQSDVQPITVVIMLDSSGSMTMNLDLLKDAAEQFILRLLPDDKARVGTFSDKIIISPRSGFSSNRDLLVRALRDDFQFGNPTHLWDAIDESMNALANQTGRRVVLVFTDGEDDRSRRVDFDEVLTRAQNEEFMVYAIGLHGQVLTRTTRPDRNLRRLAEQTGGGFFELRRTADLTSTFSRVADELHRQYVIGFTPANLDGTVHKLDVQAKVGGMTVRARKSYLASPAGAVASPQAKTDERGRAD